MNNEFENYIASTLSESLGLEVRVQIIDNCTHILAASSPTTPYTRDMLLDAIDRLLARPGFKAIAAPQVHVYFQSHESGEYLWEAEFARGQYLSDIPVPPSMPGAPSADPVSETEKQINTILRSYLNMGVRVEIFQDVCHIYLFSNASNYDKGFIIECVDRQLLRFKAAGIRMVRVYFKFANTNKNEWEISFEPGAYLSKAPPVSEYNAASPYSAVEKQIEGYLARYIGMDTKVKLDTDTCFVSFDSDTCDYTTELLLDALDRRLLGFDSYLAGKKISVTYPGTDSSGKIRKEKAVFDFGYYAYNKDKTASFNKMREGITPEKWIERAGYELAEVIRQHLNMEAKVSIVGPTCHIWLESGYESDRNLILNGIDRRASKFLSQVSTPIQSFHVYFSLHGQSKWEEEFEAGYYMNINKASREKQYKDPFGF